MLGAGPICIYNGTQPVSVNAPLAGNDLLVTLTFALVPFATPVGGTTIANVIASGNAVGSGVATFARFYEVDGVTPVCDVSAGAPGSGNEMIISDPTISPGLTVSCSFGSITYPDGA